MFRKFIPMIVFALLFTTVIQTHTAEASTRDNVVSYAKEQLGVPYRFGGTTPSGFDCSGFIRYVMNQVGVSMPRTANEQYNTGTAIAKSDLKKGDLVFFETYKPGPSHSGIYVGDGKFIHASSSRGISISSVNDPYYWGSRYLGAKRVIKDESIEVAVKKAEPARVLGEGEYRDVLPIHWAFNEIKVLSKGNMISGYGDGLFAPNDKVTRAQIAALITRATSLPTSGGTTGYSDVPANHWSASSIAAMERAGYFSYIEGGSFNMNQPVTREEIAVLFAKAFDLANAETLSASTASTFADVDQSNWAYEEIHALQASGIVQGFDDGTYRPSGHVTRAEFSKILHTTLHN